jgi:glycosyltransferase involved in cell wall biosynthesis
VTWPKAYYPKLSIIIPSYNQGRYLEETLLSVITQQYPNLELIVIDGGSTDNSTEIIKKHEKFISYWVSENDNGQSHAINKGIRMATGEWIAWLNSDDCYLEGALWYIFNEIECNQYDFLYGNCFTGSLMDEKTEHRHPPQAKKELKDILRFFYHSSHIIPSQSVFIRKLVLEKAGMLDETLHYCMDLDWFSRIYLQTDRRFFYDKTICFYRIDTHTKTSNGYAGVTGEALVVATKYAVFLKPEEKRELQQLIRYFAKLRNYIMAGKNSVIPLLKLAFVFPSIAFADNRFRHLFLKSIYLHS